MAFEKLNPPRCAELQVHNHHLIASTRALYGQLEHSPDIDFRSEPEHSPLEHAVFLYPVTCVFPL